MALQNKGGKEKELRTVQSIESIYRIFCRYKSEAKINEWYYYVWNKLCLYFIEYKQLGKSPISVIFFCYSK